MDGLAEIAKFWKWHANDLKSIMVVVMYYNPLFLYMFFNCQIGGERELGYLLELCEIFLNVN